MGIIADRLAARLGATAAATAYSNPDLEEESRRYGYTVKYINRAPRDYYGKHFAETKTIELYVKTRTPEQVRDTLLHELGHIIDYARRGIVNDFGGGSIRDYNGEMRPYADHDMYFRSPYMLKEAEAIRKEFPKTHTLSTTQKEIWADAYRLFRTAPDRLREIAPNIYKEIFDFTEAGKEGVKAEAMAVTATVYHVAASDDVPSIMQNGIIPNKKGRLKNQMGGALSDKGKVYVFSDFDDAARWAFRSEFGTGKKQTILKIGENPASFETDTHFESAGATGDWLKREGVIPPENIVGGQEFTPEMASRISLNEENEAKGPLTWEEAKGGMKAEASTKNPYLDETIRHDEAYTTVRKFLAKMKKLPPEKKNNVWLGLSSRDDIDTVLSAAILSLPGGQYTMNKPETNSISDALYEMFGMYAAVGLEESLFLGLSARWPELIHASFTHDLQLIDILGGGRFVRSEKVVASSDAEYIAAAEAGDLEKCQAMVDQAAKEAGYDVGPVIHQTNAEKFNVFDINKARSSGRSKIGFWFTDNEDAEYGRNVVRAFLNLAEPIAFSSWSEFDLWADSNEASFNDTSSLRNKLKKSGYDGIEIAGDTDGFNQKIMVVLDPNQIKSADAITYDDSGNIIPLSKRFNSASNDIRASLQKEPWQMTKEEFVANAPEGYAYKEAQPYAGQRADGTTNVSDAFFDLDEDSRKDLLNHEVGHDLTKNFSQDFADVFEPLKKGFGKDAYGQNRQMFENPFGYRENPEEIIADTYASLFQKNPYEEKGHRYDNLRKRVAEIAIRDGYPVPQDIYAEYPDLQNKAKALAMKVVPSVIPTLKVKEYDGTVGRRNHITRTEEGTIDPRLIAHLAGEMGERRGEHRNRLGAEWDEFKADIAKNGIRNPILILQDYGNDAKISEGNHRLDAALELGLSQVPVDIRYFGHSEREGLAYKTPQEIKAQRNTMKRDWKDEYRNLKAAGKISATGRAEEIIVEDDWVRVKRVAVPEIDADSYIFSECKRETVAAVVETVDMDGNRAFIMKNEATLASNFTAAPKVMTETMEEGESPDDAVIRGLKEEFGISDSDCEQIVYLGSINGTFQELHNYHLYYVMVPFYDKEQGQAEAEGDGSLGEERSNVLVVPHQDFAQIKDFLSWICYGMWRHASDDVMSGQIG